MGKGEKILAVAAREIGYHEKKNHDNKYGRWFGMNYASWCVIFGAAWCYAEACVIGDVVGRKFAEGGLYSCSQTLDWYRQHQPDCIRKEGVPGCLTIFDFPKTKYQTDHMGLYVRCENGKLTTIDGNTSNTSEGNGGWVQRRTRNLKDLVNVWYIVPRELEEEEMKRYNTIAEIEKDAPWAVETVLKMLNQNILTGTDEGLDLSMDMLRIFVTNDRAGLYK